MRKGKNDLLINEIISNIPKKCKPVNFIASELKISKSSAYRRLEGKQPFLFGEICELATKMNFSVDEIIRDLKQVHKQNTKTGEENNTDDMFFEILESYHKFIEAFYQHAVKIFIKTFGR
jgi:hypothetical protein